MNGKSFVLLSLSFLLLAVMYAVPSFAAPLLSDAALICSSTPTAAAGNSASSQITPDDPAVGNAACGNLCQKWIGTCKGAAGAAKACMTKSVAKVAGIRKAMCKELDAANRDACNALVKTEQDAAKDFLKTDLGNAFLFCESNGLASCINNCS